MSYPKEVSFLMKVKDVFVFVSAWAFWCWAVNFLFELNLKFSNSTVASPLDSAIAIASFFGLAFVLVRGIGFRVLDKEAFEDWMKFDQTKTKKWKENNR
jgi:hypothetical protein